MQATHWGLRLMATMIEDKRVQLLYLVEVAFYFQVLGCFNCAKGFKILNGVEF